MARERGIVFTVGNFRKSASPGTRIGVSSASGRDERATAIADQARLLVYDLQVRTQREALQVKEWLDRWRLTYYELESAGNEVRLAVRPFKYRDVTAIVEEILSKRAIAHSVNKGDFALVSVVGEALRGRLSTWAEESNAVLAKGGVEVHGRNQGEISLSFLVPEAQRAEAVGLLHERLVVR
jgi:aspartokinase